MSSVVTAADVGVLALGLHRGLPVAAADALSVGLAASASLVLRRASPFDDPARRWWRTPEAVAAVVGAAALDVAVVALAAPGPGPSARRLAGAKCLALVLGGGLRVVAYRTLLLGETRRRQAVRRRRPPDPGGLRLTVVVPAYGEASRIGETVRRLDEALSHVAAAGGVEVVVVDDGSPDGTADAAAAAGARVVRCPENRGKGAAVRAGVAAARGRTVAFTDADLAYPPVQLVGLLAEVEAGFDVAVGSRRHPRSTEVAQGSPLRAASGRLFNLLTALVLLGHYRDTQCGLKAFRGDVARSLFARARLDGFAFDVEVLHLVERDGLSLTEVPVTLVAAEGSTVRVALDALRMVRDLFRVRRWSRAGLYDGPAPVVSPPPWRLWTTSTRSSRPTTSGAPSPTSSTPS